jgi:hypothetical protein
MTTHHQSLVLLSQDGEIALRNAITLWADSCTASDSARREDLLRDKQRAVRSFFNFIKKSPNEVTPTHVKAWQQSLERDGLP